MALIGVRRALIKPKSGIVGPPVLAFVAQAVSTTAGAVATFTAMNIGTTAGFTTRRIILTLLAPGNAAGFHPNLVSVTIGGITATIHVATATGVNDVAVVSADVPTGTTANIVATCGGTLFVNLLGATYSVDDALLISTTPSTASGSTAGATSDTTGSFTQTAGGFAIAGNALTGNAGGTGTSIAGFTIDALGGSGNKEYFGNLRPVATTVTGTVTANWTTSQAGTIAVAAWR